MMFLCTTIYEYIILIKIGGLFYMNKSIKNEKNNLIDISTIVIDENLDVKNRIEQFKLQIKDPYHFLCNGVEVRVVLSNNNLNVEECLKEYLKRM